MPIQEWQNARATVANVHEKSANGYKYPPITGNSLMSKRRGKPPKIRVKIPISHPLERMTLIQQFFSSWAADLPPKKSGSTV